MSQTFRNKNVFHHIEKEQPISAQQQTTSTAPTSFSRNLFDWSKIGLNTDIRSCVKGVCVCVCVCACVCVCVSGMRFVFLDTSRAVLKTAAYHTDSPKQNTATATNSNTTTSAGTNNHEHTKSEKRVMRKHKPSTVTITQSYTHNSITIMIQTVQS